jgi:sulfur carrier protein
MSSSTNPSSQSENQPKAAQNFGKSVIVNGEPVPFDGGTITELLKLLDIKTRAIAVELNREVVPADQHETTRISPGDQLEVVTLVGGG